MQVVVPDLGDFSDVEVVEVLVKPGDRVEREAPLIALETDKATMEVPAPAAGVVGELRVARGDRVSSGDPVLVLETAEPAEPAADSAPAGVPTPQQAPDEQTVRQPRPGLAASEPVVVTVPDLGDFSAVPIIEVLVAVGDEVAAEQGLVALETEKASMDVPAPIAGRVLEIKAAVGDRVSTGDAVAVLHPRATSVLREEPPETLAPSVAPARDVSRSAPVSRAGSTDRLPRIDESSFARAHASPSVRKLARELGVDLGSVRGSGQRGRVTAPDVKAFVKQFIAGGGGAALPKVPAVDFAKFGEIEIQALTRIQRISGPRLHAVWVNVPHVTQHDEADITALEEKRRALKAEAESRGIRLTPLAFIIRACVLSLAEFPRLKSSLSADGESLVLKRYTHIGFAADTPNGLVVPVIRDADRKDVYELAAELAKLSERARAGRLAADDIQGGVFTISSLGGIGGTFFTPIINAPEVAILGVSRSQWRPVHENGAFVPRLMLPLSLSYDHRVVDGAEAVRFTTHLARTLTDVERLLEAAA